MESKLITIRGIKSSAAQCSRHGSEATRKIYDMTTYHLASESIRSFVVRRRIRGNETNDSITSIRTPQNERAAR
jgi:hypothetical protein